jgi:hypothetical protein
LFVPLDSAQARTSVLDQVEWLCASQTPLQLFLGADIGAVGFRQQLDDSVGKGELPAKWQDWQGLARIIVVVRLDASVDQGLLYCFFPLGAVAVAPFAGYINANFYTKMDRRSLNESIGLNQYFIQLAAKLVRPGD